MFMSHASVGLKVRALTIRNKTVQEGRREGMVVRAHEYPKSMYISSTTARLKHFIVARVVARASRVGTTVYYTLTTTNTEFRHLGNCRAIFHAFLSHASDHF